MLFKRQREMEIKKIQITLLSEFIGLVLDRNQHVLYPGIHNGLKDWLPNVRIKVTMFLYM